MKQNKNTRPLEQIRDGIYRIIELLEEQVAQKDRDKGDSDTWNRAFDFKIDSDSAPKKRTGRRKK